jgi:hypothetical protein
VLDASSEEGGGTTCPLGDLDLGVVVLIWPPPLCKDKNKINNYLDKRRCM